MRGLMRLLFMFGPMILRQVQKYQRNKQRQGYQQDRNYPSRQQQQQQEGPRRRRQETPPPPPEPKMTEEERNFKLKEEDIMLDNETTQGYAGNNTTREAHEMDYKEQAESKSNQGNPDPRHSEDNIVPSGSDKKDADGFELKDLFFEDEDPA